VFAGKVLATLTYTFTVVFALGLVGLLAGSMAWGFHPLTSLSGTKVAPGHGLVLLLGSLLVYFLPLAGIACFGLLLSTVTRNSAASVVGSLMFALLMQLLGVLPGTEAIRPYLLGTQFEAWHGFLRTPADWVPVVRAIWVCALYILIPIAAAYLVFLRRDVASQSRLPSAGQRPWRGWQAWLRWCGCRSSAASGRTKAATRTWPGSGRGVTRSTAGSGSIARRGSSWPTGCWSRSRTRPGRSGSARLPPA